MKVLYSILFVETRDNVLENIKVSEYIYSKVIRNTFWNDQLGNFLDFTSRLGELDERFTFTL